MLLTRELQEVCICILSFLQRLLRHTSCGPTYKLCMPSELVVRCMSKVIDVEFEMREASTQRRLLVHIGLRRGKAKFEYLLLVRAPSTLGEMV